MCFFGTDYHRLKANEFGANMTQHMCCAQNNFIFMEKDNKSQTNSRSSLCELPVSCLLYIWNGFYATIKSRNEIRVEFFLSLHYSFCFNSTLDWLNRWLFAYKCICLWRFFRWNSVEKNIHLLFANHFVYLWNITYAFCTHSNGKKNHFFCARHRVNFPLSVRTICWIHLMHGDGLSFTGEPHIVNPYSILRPHVVLNIKKAF